MDQWTYLLSPNTGLTKTQAKIVAFALRKEFVNMAQSDLKFVPQLSESDGHVLRIAGSQLSRAATKLISSHKIPGNLAFIIKTEVDQLEATIKEKPVVDASATLAPPLLSLVPGSALDTQVEWIPFTERLLRLEDVDGY